VSQSDQPRTNPEVAHDEREALATAMDALANAVDAAQAHLRSVSPVTRAFISEHESWPENFIWTDGSQVAKAARCIAALLRRNPAHSEPPARSGRRRAGRSR
jgi:hypothetical protein